MDSRSKKIESYYDQYKFEDGHLASLYDWKHAETGAVKGAQGRSTPNSRCGNRGHARQGWRVACADCHMPYMRQNGQKYTSHWVTSPMRQIDVSCAPLPRAGQASGCLKIGKIHTGKGLAVAEDRRQRPWPEAHRGDSPTPMHAQDQARTSRRPGSLLRKAQWYWDFVAAENGMGFHNPPQALNILGQSIQLSNEAILTVRPAGK